MTVFIGSNSDTSLALGQDILKLRAANKNRNKPPKVDSIFATYLVKTPTHLFDIAKVIDSDESTMNDIVSCLTLIRDHSSDVYRAINQLPFLRRLFTKYGGVSDDVESEINDLFVLKGLR